MYLITNVDFVATNTKKEIAMLKAQNQLISVLIVLLIIPHIIEVVLFTIKQKLQNYEVKVQNNQFRRNYASAVIQMNNSNNEMKMMLEQIKNSINQNTVNTVRTEGKATRQAIRFMYSNSKKYSNNFSNTLKIIKQEVLLKFIFSVNYTFQNKICQKS